MLTCLMAHNLSGDMLFGTNPLLGHMLRNLRHLRMLGGLLRHLTLLSLLNLLLPIHFVTTIISQSISKYNIEAQLY